MMAKVLKLMPDYQCFPLWLAGNEFGNADPGSLPLSDELKIALNRWAQAYDLTLNQDYPPDSKFQSKVEEDAFEAEAMRLRKELQIQLGTEFKIVYYSQREGRLFE